MEQTAFESALPDLKGGTASLGASAVISSDGIMLASTLPKNVDEDRIGSMLAAILSLGDKTGSELGLGILEKVIIKGESGHVVLTNTGQDTVSALISRQRIMMDQSEKAKIFLV